MSWLYSIYMVHDLWKLLRYQINNHSINTFQSGLKMFHLFAGLVDMDDLVKHRHRHKNTNISLSKELPDLQPFASNIKACFLFIGSTTPWYVCVVIFSTAFIDDWKKLLLWFKRKFHTWFTSKINQGSDTPSKYQMVFAGTHFNVPWGCTSYIEWSKSKECSQSNLQAIIF